MIMRKLSGTAIIVLTCSFAVLSHAVSVGFASRQDPAEPQDVFIDSLQISELPLAFSRVSLTKIKGEFVLKLTAANSSNEELLGVRYWLLAIDSNNKVRSTADESESLKLDAYASKEASFRPPSRLKIGNDDRVFLVVAQVIGRESIWEVQKAKEALQAYAKGEDFSTPRVLRVMNQVDSQQPRVFPVRRPMY